MDLVEINLDAAPIAALAQYMKAAGNRTPDAVRRALNHSGDIARTKMRRALTEKTGLPYRVIKAATHTTHANYGALVYSIKARGGNVRLKFFKPRETQRGVSAAPRGQRRVFPNTFIKGGQFPNRVGLHMGGEVFERIGSGHGRPMFKRARSGVFIPTDMVSAEVAETFIATGLALLPGRVAHEVGRILGVAAR
ncbi:MAG: hypothetical protein GC182_08610 [Rhodopseudomonas sp.]|nr:hypothetical protein [Rhodopseudomonas sp.]